MSWHDALNASELVLSLPGGALALLAARKEGGAARAFWLLLAVSSAFWPLAGGFVGGPAAPHPLGLGAFAAVAAALPLGFRGATRGDLARRLVDASAVGVTIGVAGWALVVHPQHDRVWVAYGVASLGVLILLGGLLVARDGRPPVAVALAGAGAALAATVAAVSAQLAAQLNPAASTFLASGTLLAQLVLCLAARAALRDDASTLPHRRRRRSDRTALVVLALVAPAVATLLVVSGGLSREAFAVSVYGAIAIGLRQALTGREHEAIAHELETALEAQYQLAVTDALTGLHNRRFFEESLQLAAGRSKRAARSVGLLVIDLDHFKDLNDRYGHPAGDSVLLDAARRFAEIARPGDLVARYGGEEFVVMVWDVRPDVLAAVAERYRAAIAERPFVLPGGESVHVLTSVGGACMPDHAATTDELVRVADKALYDAKRLGRDQVCLGQTREAPTPDSHVPPGVLEFLRDLAGDLERHFSADEHGSLMASWAALVCDELGLSAVTRRRCVLAARLHDIGKIGVPTSILEKPGRLTPEEWRVVEQHPAIGARIVGLVSGLEDVATVIAAHHERPDGTGYPCGTKSFPIEARIVAVLDAWASMTTKRPYRAALDREHARAELTRGAGIQFDEDIVRTVLELEEAGLLTLAAEARETRAA